MDFFRKHLRKKNKNSIEEQNAQNKEKWKELGISTKFDTQNRIAWNTVMAKLQHYKSMNVDDEYLHNFLMQHLPDGKIKIDGKFIWICKLCPEGTMYDSKEEWVRHALSKHG